MLLPNFIAYKEKTVKFCLKFLGLVFKKERKKKPNPT